MRWTATRQVHHGSADKIVTIDPGSGTTAALQRLADAGIVRHPLALRLYLFVTRQGGLLRAGDYKFASPISPMQALDKIHRGEVYYERITIPEGFNRFEIAEVLAAKTGKVTAEQVLQQMSDRALIASLAPNARSLEGYLFPDTYAFTTRTTTEDLIRGMVRKFEEVFTPEMASRASQLGMTVNQAVTLASIIEKEAKVPEDRPLIASVLRNRLNRGMPLAADPTFIYAALLAGDYNGNPNQPRHRKRESPYNTYIHAGLPPGPIASPGRASLEAALYPADTDYLYYVLATADGRHKFSRTVEEHEAAVAQYHLLRQQQNQNGSH